MLGVRHNDVEHVRLVGVEHPLQRRPEVAPVHDPLGRHVEALDDLHIVGVNLLHVVRVAEVGVAAVAGVKAVLPLHHHAEVLVVENDGLGRDLLDARGGQFLDVHQERAVAVDVDHLLVRAGDLGP